MQIIIISIVAVLTASFLIYMHAGNRSDTENLCIESKESIDKSCLLLTLQPCRSVIDKALECISSYDDLAVCKNHRLGSEILCSVGKQIREFAGNGQKYANIPAIYHEYMLEAAEKIAETSRHIITSPGSYVPLQYKCEIETIRQSLDRLLQSADNILRAGGNTAGLEEKIDSDTDFIKHVIDMHYKDVSYDNFDEDKPAYSYLMLLYYIMSFLSSFSHICRLTARELTKETA